MHTQQNVNSYKFNSHLTANSQDLHYKNQSVNAAFGNSIMRCVHSKIHTAVLLIKLLFVYVDFSLFGAPSSKVKFVNVCVGEWMQCSIYL